MASGKPVEEAEAKEFVKLYQGSESIKSIARKHSRSPGTVKHHLVKQGAISDGTPKPDATAEPVEPAAGQPPDEPDVVPAAQDPPPSALRLEFDRLLERLGLNADMGQETGRTQVHLGLCNSPHCAPCAETRKKVLEQTVRTVRKGTLEELATAAEWAGEVEAANRVSVAFEKWVAADRPEVDEPETSQPDRTAGTVIITP